MSAPLRWLSRVTPKPEIGYKDVMALGSLDPYGQHQALWRLFDLPPKEVRAGQPVPFLFRAEQLNGLPLLYVLSEQCPQDRLALWRIEPREFTPDIRAGDRLSFKLRVNPVVSRAAEKGQRGKRHDVVMDAKQRMGWKALPEKERPTLAHLAYEAGACWLRDRQEDAGIALNETALRVDGYRNWRQRGGKEIALSTLDFEGELTVTDSARLVAALLRGIGPAKAFGCGLLLLRRLR